MSAPLFRLDSRQYWLLVCTLGGLLGLIGFVLLAHAVAVR
jgi:hypothetical protein